MLVQCQPSGPGAVASAQRRCAPSLANIARLAPAANLSIVASGQVCGRLGEPIAHARHAQHEWLAAALVDRWRCETSALSAAGLCHGAGSCSDSPTLRTLPQMVRSTV